VTKVNFARRRADGGRLGWDVRFGNVAEEQNSIELEEAYITTIRRPADLQLKAGSS